MESEVRQLTFSQLNTIASDLNIEIYWPNVAVNNPANEHLRVLLINTEPAQTNICNGAAKHQWILQLSIYVRDGIGEIRPSIIADELKERLPFGTVLSDNDYSFRINRTANIIPAVYVDSWMIIPVQFRLETIK